VSLHVKGDLSIITPNPVLDALLTHFMLVYGNAVFVGAVIEDPQPVSINLLYSTFHGKKALTNAGRAYRDALASAVARSTHDWKTAHRLVYQEGGGATLLLALYFEQMKNKSWKPNGKTEKGEPTQPHKKQDSSNYIKIAEDAVARGCGIDDCNNINHLIHKGEDPKRPRTELIYIVHP